MTDTKGGRKKESGQFATATSTTEVYNLLKEHPTGVTVPKVAKKLDIGNNTARRYLNRLVESKNIEKTQVDGNTVLYYLVIPDYLVPIEACLIPLIEKWQNGHLIHENPHKRASICQDELRETFYREQPIFAGPNPTDVEIVKRICEKDNLKSNEDVSSELWEAAKDPEAFFERLNSINTEEITKNHDLVYYEQQQHKNPPEKQRQIEDLDPTNHEIYNEIGSQFTKVKVSQIDEWTDIPRRTIQTRINNLVEDGYLVKEKIGHTHVFYNTNPVPSKVISILDDKARAFLENGETNLSTAGAYEDILECIIHYTMLTLKFTEVPDPNEVELMLEGFENRWEIITWGDLANAYFDKVEEERTPIGSLYNPKEPSGTALKRARQYLKLTQEELAKELKKDMDKDLKKSTLQSNISKVEKHNTNQIDKNTMRNTLIRVHEQKE